MALYKKIIKKGYENASFAKRKLQEINMKAKTSKPGMSLSKALRDQRTFNRDIKITRRKANIRRLSGVSGVKKIYTDNQKRIRRLNSNQLKDVAKSKFLDKSDKNLAKKILRSRGITIGVKKRKKTKRRKKK